MTAVPEAAVAPIEEVGSPSTAPSPWRRLRRDPAFVIAFGYIVVLVVCAIFASVVAPADPLKQNLSNVLKGPSTSNWLGTDELGRDTLSRLLFAAQISLKASVLAVGVALLLGFPLGLFVGYRGGRWEAAAMRVSDAMMALPGLLIVIAVIGVIGDGLVPAMVALGVVLSPAVLRLTRGVALNVRNEPYIDAARVLGLPTRRIIRRHLMPHVMPALIVQTSLLLGAALLIEAGLSFIGLGIQPPEASWGSMLSKAAGLFRRQTFLLIPPGLAITITVLALNVIGDSIRDAMSWNDRAAPARRNRGVSTAATTPVGAGSESEAVLQITNLTVAFQVGDEVLPAISDVSLTVHPGEVVGLVGESGCGKTVTARASMSLLPSNALVLGGSVRVDGVELVGAGERVAGTVRGNQIAMIFQDPTSSLDPSYTVGNQIGESLRVHRGMSRRESMRRAAELMAQVGIADADRRVRSYPHEFSGGMLQRVAIAAALACEPKVLIADEPTTALDVTVQSEILELLRSLSRERGMAIVMVTHDLGVVADLCDSVVVMYAGQSVEQATTETLFSEPRHPYTQALLAAMPTATHKGSELPTIPGTVPSLAEIPTGCRFVTRCPVAEARCAAPVALRPVDREGHCVRCVLVES